MAQQRRRQLIVAFIGLGANLSNPIARVKAAREALRTHPDLREIACSRLYRSAPLGPADQPDYINAVMAVETTLAPDALLHILQTVEADHGRARSGERWGPRTLDLDLLLYGRETIETEELQVPHPGIAGREFVLRPLLDIAPQLDIPGRGPIADLLRACPRLSSPLIPVDDDST